MDTEFRNQVYEILTCHESRFDKINATLQKILSELQSLRVAHNENSFSHTIATISLPPPLMVTATIPIKNTPPELSKIITEFQQVFTTPTTLPPKRAHDHHVHPPTQKQKQPTQISFSTDETQYEPASTKLIPKTSFQNISQLYPCGQG